MVATYPEVEGEAGPLALGRGSKMPSEGEAEEGEKTGSYHQSKRRKADGWGCCSLC